MPPQLVSATGLHVVMDTGGNEWVVMDTGGNEWVVMDTGVNEWVVMDTGGGVTNGCTYIQQTKLQVGRKTTK